MTYYTLVDYIDSFFFYIFGFSVAYLLFFAIMGLRKRSYHYPDAKKLNTFAILFPAYKEDFVIEEAVNSFLKQEYPLDKFHIIVISDCMLDTTIYRLMQLPITVLKISVLHSTKAKALNFAMNSLDSSLYDVAVIMDADNTVNPSFLHKLNNAYYSGAIAIQAHRMAKNLNTDTAILDAVSEEINNSIFRKGHVRLGFSSALIGSGMAFDYHWFKNHICYATSSGEDKELEIMLLKENIFIEYLEDVPVYDEKTQKDNSFYMQRRRWLATQIYSLKNSILDLPQAVFCGNFDYADKLIQWMIPPRILLFGFSIFFSLISIPVNWTWAIKWWGLTIILLIALSLAVPDHLANDNLKKAVWKLPKLFILMFLNLFQLKGANKKFIHTEHGSSSKSKNL